MNTKVLGKVNTEDETSMHCVMVLGDFVLRIQEPCNVLEKMVRTMPIDALEWLGICCRINC